MNKSIHQSAELVKRIKEIKLENTICRFSMRYVVSILLSIFCIGYRGKTVDIARHSNKHRTSISRFLSGDKLDNEELSHAISQTVIQTIYEESRRTGKPILCIIDDTIASKTKPSSKALNPIQSAYFHFSHLKKKQDYGHQAVGILLSCNGKTLPLATIMYDKSKSKIDIVKEIAEKLPIAPNVSYLLCDSWYVCNKLMETFLCKGFYTIGALKTNRTVYPYGKKMNVSQLAEKASCDAGLFHIVTVKGHKYHIYRYEGSLNGINNAVVLISFPVGALGKTQALRAFISTNVELSDEEILDFYVCRWDIEVFFRNCKSRLAFEKYQVRSSKAIQRLWLIEATAYLIACFKSKSFDFSEGFNSLAQIIHTEQMNLIFDLISSGIERSQFLELVA